jgi:alpha-L-fucosidase
MINEGGLVSMSGCASGFMKRILSVGLILGMAAVCWSALPCASQAETPEQRDARMGWWRDAKFGMFIHWGLYAVPAGIWKGNPVEHAGEWIMFNGKIPVPEYEPLIKEFNPVKYDAKEWVRIAKDAGMKYIVITSKHHDGFCLFDSKLTDYDAMSTPYGKDLLKPLADAAHEAGLKICWYHSILDWHHPDYLPRGAKSTPAWSSRPWDTRPTDDADLNRYIDYMKGQLRELLTNYGDIGIIWFDGGWEHTPAEIHSEEVVELIHSIQPAVIINNRIQIPQDYDTPEQHIPETGIPGRDWETCMTMNDTWGFKVNDQNWKSKEDLIRKLVDIVSKGGNFLLNVGPTAEGLIPQPSVERLAAMGEWLKVNGESIYGAKPSPFRHLEWGRCTTKPGFLYLHVFECPNGNLVVPGLKNKVKKAYLLSDTKKTSIQTAQVGDDLQVNVSGVTPDTIDKVVVLQIEGEPDVDNTLRPAKDGSVMLSSSDAEIHGQTLKNETKGDADNIGCWTNSADWLSWEVKGVKPGKYQVSLDFACLKGSEGSKVSLTAGDQALSITVKSTESWDKFTNEAVGTLEVKDSEKPVNFELRVKEKPGDAVMNLRSIKLTPQ